VGQEALRSLRKLAQNKPVLEATAASGLPRTIPSRDVPAQTRHVVLLGLLLAVAVLIRTLGWGNWSLWLDETMQVDYARRTFLDIPKVALQDGAHPPLSYLVTALTLRISSTEAALRIPSVLFSLGAAFSVFVASGGFRRFRPAFAGAALFTFLPISIHYGQEIRPYALALFLVALSQAARRRTAERGWRGGPLLHVLAATGAVYTLYFAVFPVAAGFLSDVATALRSRRENPARFRRAFIVPLTVFLLYLPWLIALSREPLHPPAMPAPRVTARLVGEFTVGLAADRQESLARPGPAAFVWSLAILGLLAARGRRVEIALQFVACAIAPLLFLLAIRHWWNLRYILLTVLPLSQSFGEGVGFAADRVRRNGGWLFGALIALLCAVEAPAIAENTRSARVDWRRPAAYLDWQFRQGRGGTVVAADQWSWWVLRYQTLRLEPPIDVGPIADTGPSLRKVVDEKGTGWIIRTPHHPVPPDVDRFLAVASPWGVFAEAEGARLYRFEKGRLVPP
jgi:hypothetical protein